MFKGTNKRTQTDLEQEIESMGAELNAYTSPEQTVYYAKCFKADVPRAVEILADILQNSKLDEDAIEKEREVILRDIEKVGMEEIIFDYLRWTGFQGTPLAQSIWGPTRNIKAFTKRDLEFHLKNQYTTDRMVLVGAGGVDHANLAELGEKHFKNTAANNTSSYPPYCRYTGSNMKVREDDMPNAHMALAVRSCGWTDPDHLPLMLAANIIGQYDRTSGGGITTSAPLAQKCAEFNQMHTYKSFQMTYRDTGLWGVYFTCDKMNITEAVGMIQHEWMFLCETVTDAEVERAKTQMRTQLLLNIEDTAYVSEEIGRSVLALGRRIPVHEFDKMLQEIDASTVRNVCAKYLYDQCPVQVGIGPTEQQEDYCNMRKRMNWLRL